MAAIIANIVPFPSDVYITFQANGQSNPFADGPKHIYKVAMVNHGRVLIKMKQLAMSNAVH